MRRHRRRAHELHGRRRTVVYQAGADGLRYELYAHMLIEDVHLRVMPLGRRWTDREFAVGLEPASERFEALLADAMEPEGRDGLTDATCEFLREAAQVVMTYGRAIYEIAYLRDDNGDVAKIDFAYVPPRSVEIKRGTLVQSVPERLSNDWDVPTEIRVPAGEFMVFEPPMKPKTLQRMLDTLAEVGRPELPEFVEQEMRGEAQVGYSSTDAIQFEKLALAATCRDIGWDGRGSFRDEFLEYYSIVRQLRFERFLAQFRAKLVATLNACLEPISEVIGESGHVRLSGLPTEADVNSALAHLEHGDRDFAAILEPFSLR